MKVAVVGLGYVGSVTAACLASRGHDVIGIDRELGKVNAVREHRSPVVEPGLDALVAEARASGRLEATTSDAAAAGCDVVILCVATPSNRSGRVDLSALETATRQVGHALAGQRGHPVVLVRSTVPPGTTEAHLIPLLEGASGRSAGSALGVGSCPEFLRESTAIEDFLHPPFVVVGTSDPVTVATSRELFGFVDAPFRQVQPTEAETLKLACNTFHALKVVFANEIGQVCRAAGTDGRKVMQLFCEDRQLNISDRYLRPGFSYGGSCLTKDLRALLHFGRARDLDLPVIGNIGISNDRQRADVLEEVLDTGADRVAVLGLSFKAGTDDLRESPYVDLVESLVGKGIDVRIYDTHINPARLFGANLDYVSTRLPHFSALLRESAAEALEGVDCAVVSTCDEAVATALRVDPPMHLVDVCGDLPADLESIVGYRGSAW